MSFKLPSVPVQSETTELQYALHTPRALQHVEGPESVKGEGQIDQLSRHWTAHWHRNLRATETTAPSDTRLAKLWASEELAREPVQEEGGEDTGFRVIDLMEIGTAKSGSEDWHYALLWPHSVRGILLVGFADNSIAYKWVCLWEPEAAMEKLEMLLLLRGRQYADDTTDKKLFLCLFFKLHAIFATKNMYRPLLALNSRFLEHFGELTNPSLDPVIPSHFVLSRPEGVAYYWFESATMHESRAEACKEEIQWSADGIPDVRTLLRAKDGEIVFYQHLKSAFLRSELEAAVECHKKGIALCPQTAPDINIHRLAYAMCLSKLGKFDEAEREYLATLEVLGELEGGEDMNMVQRRRIANFVRAERLEDAAKLRAAFV